MVWVEVGVACSLLLWVWSVGWGGLWRWVWSVVSDGGCVCGLLERTGNRVYGRSGNFRVKNISCVKMCVYGGATTKFF